jgi:hypothetical protein
MSIEDIVYSAEEHGRRNLLFNEVSILRKKTPNRDLTEIYEEAYRTVMNT